MTSIVKQRVYSRQEMCSMSHSEYWFFQLCLEARDYRLLGIDYKKYVRVSWDKLRGDLLIEWE